MGTSRPAEVLTGSTDFYTVYTQIDITDTEVDRPTGTPKDISHDKTVNTFIQTITLKSQTVLNMI